MSLVQDKASIFPLAKQLLGASQEGTRLAATLQATMDSVRFCNLLVSSSTFLKINLTF